MVFTFKSKKQRAYFTFESKKQAKYLLLQSKICNFAAIITNE